MSNIKLLEDRIANLEKQMYGIGKTANIDDDDDDSAPQNPIVDRLLDINSLLYSALSGRENPSVIIKRFPELNSYLEPFSEDVDMPASAKIQLLLTMEPEIMENYKLLTKVQELAPVLESERIKNVPELNNTFNKLSLSYLKAYEDSEELNAHVRDLLSKYNAVINSISESLLTLNAAVTAAEVAAKPKKQIDD
ncbi:dynactin subunit 3-like [Pseudomyrmex gracilis]|uniref:dynactin subunit 3-like n=1 Tax=Pseudomyrmex gracilis TaxID=219809 RepID=UPI0009954835|nr:dynactin subunit 3-like [Pseudomyrmex gracilis]